MRFLLASEGESDELVAETLIRYVDEGAEIAKKKMPARGFVSVRKSIPTLVHAAHFQLFHVLVIHFDLNSTLERAFKSVQESQRWKDAEKRVQDTIKTVKQLSRPHPLQVVFMAPCQSTEAWLDWGLYGGDGSVYERKYRKDLKKHLFGDPPRGIAEKMSVLLPDLRSQMDSNKQWPISLREFISSLQRVVEAIQQ